MRHLATLLLVICSPLLLAPSAHAERRVALVIGNGEYKAAPLRNPVNDARDMAAALRDMGFEVITRENASLAQMEGAVNEFWQRLKKGGAGLFYFAGHGLQVNGRNYLVPVDALLAAEQDARFKCMDAGLVLGRMENAGNGLNIVILDACRTNPFSRSWRTAEMGLAKMDAPKGSIIAYATAPDSVAADGGGRNGVYTEKLLRAMRVPGLPVEQVFKRVRDEVMRTTKDKQVPWESTSLRGDFYFVGMGKGVIKNASADFGATPLKDSAIAAGKQRLSEEEARLKQEKDELAQLQIIQAEQARIAEERQKVEREKKQLALAPLPEQPPYVGAAQQAPTDSPGKTWTDPVTGMEFVWVPGGSFARGCGWWRDDCFSNQEPMHTVRLTGFWLGKYEVTQGQWQQVMGYNPSKSDVGEAYPVERVSWNDAKEFISRLADLGPAKFRLPTEAEWEYAARNGGKHEKFAGGDDIDRVAWHLRNSHVSVHPVGAKAPNGLGIHDMTGNVQEWCEDAYARYPSSSLDNPVVTSRNTSYRVLRGGGCADTPNEMHTYRRAHWPADYRNICVGFRLVRIPE